MSNERKNRWVKCKGCGEPLGLFPEGLPPRLPKNAVGHTKPKGTIAGIPRAVSCRFYTSMTAEELIKAHDDVPDMVPQPTKFVPFTN